MGCVDNIRIQVTREALEKRAFRSLKVLHRGLLGPLGGMHVKLRTLARVASLTIYREVAPDVFRTATLHKCVQNWEQGAHRRDISECETEL